MLDTNVNRRNSNNIKWSPVKKDPGVLPMTIADMDIATPVFIREALQHELDQRVLGYSMPMASFYDAIIQWEWQRHNVSLLRDQLILLPSVVTGLAFVIRHLTQTNDSIIVMSPYYPPYRRLVEGNQRQMIDFPLVQREGQYVIDFERLDQVMSTSHARAILVCNPHNPGGRVWTTAEMLRLQDLASQHQVLVIADEIHDDTTFSDNEPVSLLANRMGESAVEQTVLLKSASKAFNIAGTKLAYLAVKNPELLAKLQQAADAEAIQEVNTLGVVATQTAYEHGERWLNEVNQYLQDNRDYAYEYIRENIPLIRPMLPQATYLMWLDFMAYDLTDQALDEHLQQDGRLMLNPGIEYGQSGSGFMRLNFAVDRSILKDALSRLVSFDHKMRKI